jgi:hypothetical protein
MDKIILYNRLELHELIIMKYIIFFIFYLFYLPFRANNWQEWFQLCYVRLRCITVIVERSRN